MKTRIAAVVVLYKMDADHSVSYRTLLEAERAAAGTLDLQIFLHSNSPGASTPAALPDNVRFFADPANGGLASAYNRVLGVALAEGYDWMLTLDQDTRLPLDTFARLLEGVAVAEERREIAAIVPQIRVRGASDGNSGGRIVSPHAFAAGAWPRGFPPGWSGVPDQTVFAFNSGALLRTAALRQVGGYDPAFWLDGSDLNLFQQLSHFGKRVYVAGELELQHEFSMLNARERVPPERYRGILSAESAFWDTHRSGLAGLERTARLALRAMRWGKRRESADLRRLTLRQLWLRLGHTRSYRMARWNGEAMQRRQAAERLEKGAAAPVPALPAPPRPMISVCMAAYNGARYIDAQLGSIVPQLTPADEIVVIDDASRDRTLELLRAWKRRLADDPLAPSLVLIQHSANRGVIHTFEEAVRSATGDILFLSDDDDLWAPDKVQEVLAVFAMEPAIQVVATNLMLIDENGNPLVSSDFLQHRRFTDGLWANLLHNQFQGSAMAFRSTLLRHVLPFPAGRLFLHDVWIGTRNTLAGGAAAFVDKPLLLYRRHNGNFSRRFSRWKQVLLRLQLVAAHLRHFRWRLH